MDTVDEALSVRNAPDLFRTHDVVLDCTDNALTRYLISDAAVLADREVVSGAAQGTDGQLVVLNRRLSDTERGPCYRCLFPRAPQPEHVQSCDDGGVLGGVTGLIGTMQALETIKLLTGVSESASTYDAALTTGGPVTMTFVSPLASTPFRTVRVRPRQKSRCRSCGDVPDKIVDLALEDYRTFCGLADAENIAGPRIAAKNIDDTPEKRIVLDVRPAHEYLITSLPGSISVWGDCGVTDSRYTTR